MQFAHRDGYTEGAPGSHLRTWGLGLNFNFPNDRKHKSGQTVIIRIFYFRWRVPASGFCLLAVAGRAGSSMWRSSMWKHQKIICIAKVGSNSRIIPVAAHNNPPI